MQTRVCPGDVTARILVVGHDASQTSSRRAFLSAVEASTFIVSAGPTRCGTVVLPDAEVIRVTSTIERPQDSVEEGKSRKE